MQLGDQQFAAGDTVQNLFGLELPILALADLEQRGWVRVPLAAGEADECVIVLKVDEGDHDTTRGRDEECIGTVPLG